MIVVETNLIAYLLIRGEHSELARAVFRRDPEWTAPLLWRSEYQNVLASYLRKNQITLEDALEIMKTAEELMDGGEYEVRSTDVLRLASTSGCTAYDCEFIALAEDLKVPLITTDRQILRHVPSVARSPEALIGS